MSKLDPLKTERRSNGISRREILLQAAAAAVVGGMPEFSFAKAAMNSSLSAAEKGNLSR
jgi:hypothetical protein